MKLDIRRLLRIGEILSEEVDRERIPGAVAAVGIGGETVYREAFGFAENTDGRQRAMNVGTLFDLASLTKVTATLPAVLSLVDQGALRLADPVGLFIPEFTQGEKAKVAVWHLLAHCGGLLWHRRYDEHCATPAEILQAVRSEPLVYRPGEKVVYSDLGYILLGEIVRAVTGQRIDVFAESAVFGPLGMPAADFCPDTARLSDIAATAATSDWGEAEGLARGRRPGLPHILGAANDDNARALGGVAGHAGLFAPVDDLIRYVKAWIDPSNSWLSRAVRGLSTRPHAQGAGSRRGLGWVLRGDSQDPAGDLWPATTVSHTGFTGTSMVFDPVTGLWTILLTNRVHYGLRVDVGRLRARIHNVAAASLGL